MLGRKKKGPSHPRTLAERLDEGHARRIAVLGLHPRAGTRTVLQKVCYERRTAGRPIGIVSTPRAFLPDEMVHEPETRIQVAAGTYFALATEPHDPERIELLGCEEADELDGPVWFCRAKQETEIRPTLPRSFDAIGQAANRLAVRSGGPVLVDGGWTDREFAAPGRVDAWILSAGAGLSEGLERAAAAIRYRMEALTPNVTPESLAAAWEAHEETSFALITPQGKQNFPQVHSLIEAMKACHEPPYVLVPHKLGDDLLSPLAREHLGCRLIVADATRIHLSPVYLKAWQKAGGRIEVVKPGNLLAITTNPVNMTGPDFEAEAYRDRTQKLVGDICPVHDVVLEQNRPRSKWQFWKS